MSDIARMIECYRDQYGNETEALFQALRAPVEKIALINQNLSEATRASILARAETKVSFGPQFVKLPFLPMRILGLLSHYFLDVSSIFAPLFLPISPHARVLDMCSAPGGKLLVLQSRLIDDVHFVANDLSSARTERLRRVIKDYVPRREQFIKVTNKDAISFALREPASFDAVLLDAPCSSEAHTISDPKLLKKFIGLRKSLPMRQYSLLSAALLAVKPGGHVMYQTCSINRYENEGVVEKALMRKKIPCAIVPLTVPLGQQNELGVTILPHLHEAGPAFLSLIKRL